MNSLNFISNAVIGVHKMYYEKGVENEYVELTPEQIPDIIFDALHNACRDKLILALKIFVDMTEAGKDKNYVHAIITYWDGITACKQGYELYGDGSYNTIEGSLKLL